VGRARLVSQRYVLARQVGVVQAEGYLRTHGDKATIASAAPMLRGRRGQKADTAMNAYTATSLAILNARTIATLPSNRALAVPRLSVPAYTTLESRFYAARPENRSVQPFECAPGRKSRIRSLPIQSEPTRVQARARRSAQREGGPGALPFFARGLRPTGPHYTLCRAPLRRRAPFACAFVLP
jgi:hypothetical protein